MLDETKIITLGGQLKRGIQHLGYSSSTDTVTEVIADGYFNVYREYITKGDIITFIDITNLKVHTLRVKNIPLNGNVLVEELAVNETDFNTWDKSTGISITESQISDLQDYYLASNPDGFISEETDPLSLHLDQTTPQPITANAVTAEDTDYVLILDTSDSGKTKKALKSDFNPIGFLLASGATTGATSQVQVFQKGVRITATSATDIPLTIQGATSQTANLSEWKNSAGTVIGYINEDALAYFTNLMQVSYSTDATKFASLAVGSDGTAYLATAYGKSFQLNRKMEISVDQAVPYTSGDTLVLDGDPFVDGLTNWVIEGTGTGWAYNANNDGQALHSSGNTDPLVQTITGLSEGLRYRVTWRNASSGSGATSSLTVSIAGKSLTSGSSGAKTLDFTATSDEEYLTFTPVSSFTRGIYEVRMFLLNPSDPYVQGKNLSNPTLAFRGDTSGTLFLGVDTGAYSVAQYSIGIGKDVLKYTTGGYNTAIGDQSGVSITTGNLNTLIGASTGSSLTTGIQNFFGGYFSGYNLTTGYYNLGLGVRALSTITTGTGNLGIGKDTLRYLATSSSYNSGLGYESGLQFTGTGSYNFFAGANSGRFISSGDRNLMLGYLSNPFGATTSGAYSDQLSINNQIYGSGTRLGVYTVPNIGTFSVLPEGATITGTVSVEDDGESGWGTSVVGSGTSFTTEVSVGDIINFYGIIRVVATVTDNTHLTITEAIGAGEYPVITNRSRGLSYSFVDGDSLATGGVFGDGRVAIGATTWATAPAWHNVFGTTEQQRLGYDQNNYFKTTVSSTGGVTFDAVGTAPEFIFSDTIKATGYKTGTETGITTTQTVVSDTRMNSGQLQKKTRLLTYTNGLLTAQGAESDWTDTTDI